MQYKCLNRLWTAYCRDSCPGRSTRPRRSSERFRQRQGLASGEYVVLVVGLRKAWTVLWRGALAGCSAKAGALTGCLAVCSAFTEEAYRRGCRGSCELGGFGLAGSSGGCFQRKG